MESSQPSTDSPRGVTSLVPLLILVAVLVADQVSKGLVRLALLPGQSAPESGLFRFTYVTNTGSAFGLFPNQTLFLIIASFLGIGVLLVFYRSHPSRGMLLPVILGLQLGGATGNLVDRIRLGYVVDFIDVGLWPVFNLADSAIVVGLTALLWTILTTRESAAGDEEGGREGDLCPALSVEGNTQEAELESASVHKEASSERDESPWERSGE